LHALLLETHYFYWWLELNDTNKPNIHLLSITYWTWYKFKRMYDMLQCVVIVEQYIILNTEDVIKISLTSKFTIQKCWQWHFFYWKHIIYTDDWKPHTKNFPDNQLLNTTQNLQICIQRNATLKYIKAHYHTGWCIMIFNFFFCFILHSQWLVECWLIYS
jgi:hypothetical protein